MADAGFASFAGERVTTCKLTIPLYGTWVADVVLANSTTIPVSANLEIGGLSLFGTTYRAADFAGSRSVRLVGGYGGWRKSLPPKFYNSSGGVRLSMVLGDAARESGEQIKLGQDGNIGSFYVREGAQAERVLRMLGGASWYMDNSGVTQVGARPSKLIISDYSVINWSGGRGLFEVATENYEDWMPANTFQNATVTTLQTVSSTIITQDNDGKLRLAIMNATPNPLA